MSIADWGSLGELLAALATLLTVLYLAAQIRVNTQSNRALTTLSIGGALGRHNGSISSDAELAEIWLRGLRDLHALNDVERTRFVARCLDLLNMAVSIEELERHGLGDVHIDYISWIASLYATHPGFREVVQTMAGPKGERWQASPELFCRITEPAAGATDVVWQTAEQER